MRHHSNHPNAIPTGHRALFIINKETNSSVTIPPDSLSTERREFQMYDHGKKLSGLLSYLAWKQRGGRGLKITPID